MQYQLPFCLFTLSEQNTNAKPTWSEAFWLCVPHRCGVSTPVCFWLLFCSCFGWPASWGAVVNCEQFQCSPNGQSSSALVGYLPPWLWKGTGQQRQMRWKSANCCGTQPHAHPRLVLQHSNRMLGEPLPWPAGDYHSQSFPVCKFSRVEYVSWSWWCQECWLPLQFHLISAKI